MRGRYNKILIPPTKEKVKEWLEEKYGDFESTFLGDIISKYLETITHHDQYAKKKCIKYVRENILEWDRIYRKQESLYWVKRGWSEKEAEERRIVRNKEWYIKIYGEKEGLKKYLQKNKNISNNCGHSLEKFIERHGRDLGQIKWGEYKKNCARNLEYFIKKYGEVVGKVKYKKFKKHIGKASGESMLVFRPLIEWLSNYVDNNELYYGDDDSREFFIVNNGKTYLYDLTIKKYKLIIEFNGIKFHVNENWTPEQKINWGHPFKDMNYNKSIEMDKLKRDLAERKGFKVLTIWSDIPVEENINICKNFISININNDE